MDVEDEVGEVHRPDVGRQAPAGVVVRLVEDQVGGVAALDGGHHALGRVVPGATQRPRTVRRRTDVRRARVEALELGVEVRVAVADERGGERLVEGVVAEDPGVALEGVGHVAPDLVVLALQITPHVVVPEVAEGDAGRLRAVLEGPAARRVGALDAVRAHGPVGGALAVEQLVVHVLMHVEDGVDVKASQQVDGLGQVRHVPVEDGLVELVRVGGRAGRADGGVVGRGGARLQPAPGHAQPHHVEAQAGHQGGVGRREVPGLLRVGIELIGRVLVDGVDPVEEHDPAPAVIEEGSARRRDPARHAAASRRRRRWARTASAGRVPAGTWWRRGGPCTGTHQDGGQDPQGHDQGEKPAAAHGDQSVLRFLPGWRAPLRPSADCDPPSDGGGGGSSVYRLVSSPGWRTTRLGPGA